VNRWLLGEQNPGAHTGNQFVDIAFEQFQSFVVGFFLKDHDDPESHESQQGKSYASGFRAMP
jgi:hypothetical protein